MEATELRQSQRLRTASAGTDALPWARGCAQARAPLGWPRPLLPRPPLGYCARVAVSGLSRFPGAVWASGQLVEGDLRSLCRRGLCGPEGPGGVGKLRSDDGRSVDAVVTRSAEDRTGLDVHDHISQDTSCTYILV